MSFTEALRNISPFLVEASKKASQQAQPPTTPAKTTPALSDASSSITGDVIKTGPSEPTAPLLSPEQASQLMTPDYGNMFQQGTLEEPLELPTPPGYAKTPGAQEFVGSSAGKFEPFAPIEWTKPSGWWSQTIMNAPQMSYTLENRYKAQQKADSDLLNAKIQKDDYDSRIGNKKITAATTAFLALQQRKAQLQQDISNLMQGALAEQPPQYKYKMPNEAQAIGVLLAALFGGGEGLKAALAGASKYSQEESQREFEEAMQKYGIRQDKARFIFNAYTNELNRLTSEEPSLLARMNAEDQADARTLDTLWGRYSQPTNKISFGAKQALGRQLMEKGLLTQDEFDDDMKAYKKDALIQATADFRTWIMPMMQGYDFAEGEVAVEAEKYRNELASFYGIDPGMLPPIITDKSYKAKAMQLEYDRVHAAMQHADESLKLEVAKHLADVALLAHKMDMDRAHLSMQQTAADRAYSISRYRANIEAFNSKVSLLSDVLKVGSDDRKGELTIKLETLKATRDKLSDSKVPGKLEELAKLNKEILQVESEIEVRSKLVPKKLDPDALIGKYIDPTLLNPPAYINRPQPQEQSQSPDEGYEAFTLNVPKEVYLNPTGNQAGTGAQAGNTMRGPIGQGSQSKKTKRKANTGGPQRPLQQGRE